MGVVSWPAGPHGHYWIDAAVANLELRWMIDTGMVDPLKRVGFELDAVMYDQIRQSNQFQHYQFRSHRDSSGRKHVRETGLITAQLIDPVVHQRIAPVVNLYVSRGTAGLPNRVGIVLFHRLIGCRVIWELTNQTWRIEYP